MRPAERIVAKRESASLLSQVEWTDVDLILREHGLPTTDRWNGNKYDYVISMLGQVVDDNKIIELHRFMVGETTDSPAGQVPWGEGQLKLFASHLSSQQRFVGTVGGALHRYGVSCFVAHNSVAPSDEWQSVIESALRSCDAMVVFLHEGFSESRWCDQEVGFALARRVPVLPLELGVLPYGFMGKLQADRCRLDETPLDIAARVLKWLLRNQGTQTAMTEGLVGSLERSGSYDHTRKIFARLREMPTFTPDQLERLEIAAKENDQIRDAQSGPNMIPDLIHKFVMERGGVPLSTNTPWADEEPF